MKILIFFFDFASDDRRQNRTREKKGDFQVFAGSRSTNQQKRHMTILFKRTVICLNLKGKRVLRQNQ